MVDITTRDAERGLRMLQRAAELLDTDVNNIVNELTRRGCVIVIRWSSNLQQYVVELQQEGVAKVGGASDHTVQEALARAVLRMQETGGP